MMDKKIIKEFLKPTKEKVILWIILFLISPAYLIDLPCLASMGAPCSPTEFIPLFGGVVTLVGIANNLIIGINYLFSNISVPFLTSMLILSYLLSCLIIFAYNKFRTKK